MSVIEKEGSKRAAKGIARSDKKMGERRGAQNSRGERRGENLEGNKCVEKGRKKLLPK